MPDSIKVNIYGDSLMKGTIIDENFRYHAIIADRIRRFEDTFHAKVNNRARFGITVERGARLLQTDIDRGLACDYALIEFGGNDCNFDWAAVSAAPEKEHMPFTEIGVFAKTLQHMLGLLKKANVTPVLMTLPPIDAERYLAFISRGGNDRNNILRWLGDAGMIYRFHELYSTTVARIAAKTSTLLIDIRQTFLDKRTYYKLIGFDGIHLSAEGYKMVFDQIRSFAAGVLQGAVVPA